MSHEVIADLNAEATIQNGAVVSKVIDRGEGLETTVFGFDSGEGLTEHSSVRTALVQLLQGSIRITVDGVECDARPGFWMRVSPGAPHSLVASEPSILLLTLVG